MKLTDFIAKKAIIAEMKATDKKGVIAEIVAAMKKAYPTDRIPGPELVEAILHRETKLGSTGLGGGVAIPHAHVDSVRNLVGAFGRSSRPIEFGAIDGQPVHLFFVIASPPGRKAEYIEALKITSSAIRTANFCRFLKGARTTREIEEIFREVEEVAEV
jgi:mannitol/fructose-specific phosphotransferase system IIA component (Ntr-type)